MKRALLVGWQGQDGRLLTEQLLSKGYTLWGVGRDRGKLLQQNNDHSQSLDHAKALNILDQEAVRAEVELFKPDEIYYLAAFHHAAEAKRPKSSELFFRSYEVHVQGLLHFLEAMSIHRPQCRLFYAASSHAFGSPEVSQINESTPLNPICIYGITKSTGVQCCRFYRQQHGLFASAGFLFNHESIYRRRDFLSQKIIRTAVSIKRGEASELVVGDLSAVVDWGYAGDYTAAMQSILAMDQPDDFVIATGVPHTVEDFVAIAFKALDLDWRNYVRENRKVTLIRRNPLIGDSTRIRERCGWSPSVSFEAMIFEMVRYQVESQQLGT